jgi:hypothetical protein
MKIKIACETKDSAKIEDLIIFQGDLKEFPEKSYQKLRKEIIDLGFSFPFFVWEDDGVLKLLDGTHRKKTIEKMKEEGIQFPTKLPIVKIHAKNYSEAKKKLLAVTSSYSKITNIGLSEFISDIEDFTIEELQDSFEFAGFDLSEFSTVEIPLINEENFPQSDNNTDRQDSPIDGSMPIDDQSNKKYNLLVELSNEMELRDLYNDLLSKGYIVRELKK